MNAATRYALIASFLSSLCFLSTGLAQPTVETCNQEVTRGVRYCFSRDFFTPMHIVLIERARGQNYEFRVFAEEAVDAQFGRVFRPHRVTWFAEQSAFQTLVAVNGNYWRDFTDEIRGYSPDEPTFPNQALYMNGVERAPASGDNEWIMGFAPAGPRLDVQMFQGRDLRRPDLARFRHFALGSVGCVFHGGVLCDDNLDGSTERSAIGYSDTHVIILSSEHVISRTLQGASHANLARYFRAFGATDALVLDGSSSAQMYVHGFRSPVNPITFPYSSAFGDARHVSNAIGLVRARPCAARESLCTDEDDDDCDDHIDCDDPDCSGQSCTYCSLGTYCPVGTLCHRNMHRCIPSAAPDAGLSLDGAVSDAGGIDARPDTAVVVDSGRPMDAGLDAPPRPDAGADAGTRFDAADLGVDAPTRPEVGVDAGPAADAADVPPDGVPRPPTPTLNARIPSDVTYHRTYDFTGPDTCTRCSNHPSDPYPTCAPPGFEFDVERHATESTRSGFLSANYFCPYNASGGYYDCYKEYVCTWNADPATGASCVCPRDREVSPGMPTCRATPGLGIQLTVPPGSPGAYGYNVAVWPYEPSRPAFQVGSNVYLYAQFYLPAGQDVTARPGVDCTPSADPDRDVGGVHVPSTTGPGRWHEVLIPLMATVGDFTTIREGLQNCNGWLQCMNSGIWPPNAGDARGGSCIVSRLEFAGYRDFCDLNRYDLELVVDDCVGCTLSHDLRAGSPWTEGERGTLSGSTMTWRFRGSEVEHNCQLNRQFNVQLPSGEWMIDDRWAPVEPTYGTAILIRKRARWRYMDGSTAVSSVDVACSMTRRNHDATGRTTLGHHGQVRIAGGRVVATGMPDLPCEGP